jgi:hypothetical protein
MNNYGTPRNTAGVEKKVQHPCYKRKQLLSNIRNPVFMHNYTMTKIYTKFSTHAIHCIDSANIYYCVVFILHLLTVHNDLQPCTCTLTPTNVAAQSVKNLTNMAVQSCRLKHVSYNFCEMKLTILRDTVISAV